MPALTFYGDTSMSRKSTTNTRRLEGFHASTIKTYQATRNLWEQVVARQLSVDAVQHQVHTLQTRLGALRSESQLLARFQRAYRKLPSTSAGRLITSQHGAALDAMASFVGLVADKVGLGHSGIGASGAPPGPNNSCDRERLADLAIQFQALGGLPVLEPAFTSQLEEEFHSACLLRRERRAGRRATLRRRESTQATDLLEADGKKILAICRSSMNVNNKMRRICRVDRRVLAWSSPRWASLLKATDSAVRQTEFWKKTQAARQKRGKQVPLHDR